MKKNDNEIKPFGTYDLTVVQKIVLFMIKAGLLRGSLKKVARKLWELFSKNPGAEIYDIKRWNIRWRLDFEKSTLDRILLFDYRDYDGRELDVFKSRMRQDDLVADIGANIGYWSLRLSQAFPQANFLAFEPNPIIFERLQTNIKINSFENRIQPFPYGISEKAGKFELKFFDRENFGSDYSVASMDRNFFTAQNNAYDEKNISFTNRESTIIEVKPLKNFLLEIGVDKIDAMKLVVEGHEDKVLMPYLKSMPTEKWPHTILILYVFSSCWETDIIKFLQENGYQILFDGANIILGR